MTDFTLLAARFALLARAWASPAFLNYLRDNELDIDVVNRVAGISAVIPIVVHDHYRWEFGRIGADPLGFVIEAMGRDGESVEDLVAWPIDDPANVLSMFGRVGMVGLDNAFNPATYHLDKPLRMHRTPLRWLQSGGAGAAMVSPRLAAYDFLDIAGRIAGEDRRHAQELLAIAESVVVRGRFVSPVENLRIAA